MVYGATGLSSRFEFYYGGLFVVPDGRGHGHVVRNDGETINFWRLPDSEGGRIIVDNGIGSDYLTDYGLWRR